MPEAESDTESGQLVLETNQRESIILFARSVRRRILELLLRFLAPLLYTVTMWPRRAASSNAATMPATPAPSTATRFTGSPGHS